MTSDFHLNVQQVNTVCLFELSWGQGQRLGVRIPYPRVLEQRYQEWRQLYLTFYSQLSATDSVRGGDRTGLKTLSFQPTQTPDYFRGKVVGGGQVALPPTDWHEMLVQAETALTYEFQRWLRHGDLFEIRAAIANATSIQPLPSEIAPSSATQMNTIQANTVQETIAIDSHGETYLSPSSSSSLSHRHHFSGQSPIRLFLSCWPLSLARFPWEAWELGTEFSATRTIQIVRSTLTIQSPSGSGKKHHRRRPRILVILGDNTGLNFQGDREAVQALDKLAEIQFNGWQPGQSASTVRQTICQAIANEEGWDALLFAGHSDEKDLMGGQLAIAPQVFMSIKEMSPYLAIAKRNGLQFALFNSCSGLDIAEALISIGLSQVMVMREPIHNQVAQSFIRRFMQCLAQGMNVQDAMATACRTLKLDQQFTYPSAHLVPSLFCHPHAHLFQIPERGFRQRLKALVPLRYEAIALTACLGLSLLPMTQSIGLNQRFWTQAVYRQLTHQVPSTDVPPVVLVQIDDPSLSQDGRIADPHPINRSYMADLIRQLSDHNASIIGIDYLFDRPARVPDDDVKLQAAVNHAVDQDTWLVFASIWEPSGKKVGVFTNQKSNIAQPEWVMEADITIMMDYMTLLAPNTDCRKDCPFAYLLALLHQAQKTLELPVLDRTRSTNLRTQLIDAVENSVISNQVPSTLPRNSHVQEADKIKNVEKARLAAIQQSRFFPITLWSYQALWQTWFAQLLDFSLPPDIIFDRIPAWSLLDKTTAEQIPDLSGRTVIIVPGGYAKAGINESHDNAPLPAATQYWYSQSPPMSHLMSDSVTGVPLFSGTKAVFPKGEGHAYMVHHFLTQRTVFHIPDSWVVAIAALCGYLITQQLLVAYPHAQWTRTQQRNMTLGFAGLTGLSGIISLQLYISAGLLVSWTLPTLLFWMYLLRVLRRKPHVE